MNTGTSYNNNRAEPPPSSSGVVLVNADTSVAAVIDDSDRIMNLPTTLHDGRLIQTTSHQQQRQQLKSSTGTDNNKSATADDQRKMDKPGTRKAAAGGGGVVDGGLNRRHLEDLRAKQRGKRPKQVWSLSPPRTTQRQQVNSRLAASTTAATNTFLMNETAIIPTVVVEPSSSNLLQPSLPTKEPLKNLEMDVKQRRRQDDNNHDSGLTQQHLQDLQAKRRAAGGGATTTFRRVENQGQKQQQQQHHHQTSSGLTQQHLQDLQAKRRAAGASPRVRKPIMQELPSTSPPATIKASAAVTTMQSPSPEPNHPDNMIKSSPRRNPTNRGLRQQHLDDLQAKIAATSPGQQQAKMKNGGAANQLPGLPLSSPNTMSPQRQQEVVQAVNNDYDEVLPGAYYAEGEQGQEGGSSFLYQQLTSSVITNAEPFSKHSYSVTSELQQSQYASKMTSSTSAPPTNMTVTSSQMVPNEGYDKDLEANKASNTDSNKELEEEQSKQQSNKWKWIVLGVVLLVAVLAVVVGVVMQQSNSESTATSTTTTAADGVTVIEEHILPGPLLETTEIAILNQPESSQFKAYMWLVQDPNLQQYESWQKRQRFALATFYYSFQGQQWTNQGRKDTWLQYDEGECSWKPLKCSTNMELTGIPMTSFDKGFQGTIPPEISMLSNLNSMNLAMSSSSQQHLNLEMVVPSELGMLSNFHTLKLNDCGLNGSIPSWIGTSLTTIQTLELSKNEIGNQIPSTMGLLTNLKRYVHNIIVQYMLNFDVRSSRF